MPGRLTVCACLLITLSSEVRGQGLEPPARHVDVLAEARLAQEQIQGLTAATAEAGLAGAYDRLWQLDPSQVDLASIDADPPVTIQALFAVQLALDDRMAALHEAGELTDAIANAKRRVSRAVRYLRERVVLRAAEQGARLYPDPRPTLAQEPPPQPGFDRYHWTVNPAYAQLPVRADAFPRTFFMLNEGDMTLSAAISRATAEDNSYSHYSVGYISDREHTIDGTTYPPHTVFTVESLIEQGVVIHPFPFHFEKALLDWSCREVILFLRDPTTQARVDAAADAFFERAKQAINRGRPLGYDFTMGSAAKGLTQALPGGEGAPTAAPPPRRLLDLDSFFCSGVADAIGQAAGVELFTHRSRMEPGRTARELVASWGVDPDAALPTPGDGDVSATLVRVAEGVATGDVLATHYRHAIMNAMFRWMDRDGYRVHAPALFKAGTKLVTGVNDATANTVLDLGLVPNAMTPAVMASMLPLHKAAEAFLKRVRARDEQALAETGRRLSPRELDAYLEQVRPEVDVDTWFVPGFEGAYTLSVSGALPWSKGGVVKLEVRPQSGPFYEVRRTLTRDGAVVQQGVGRGEQRGMKLRVQFDEPAAGHPRRQTYTLDRQGGISAWLGVGVGLRGQRD